MNFFLKKLTGLLYDVSVGLFSQYRDSSLGLAKIEIASVYLKIVKAIRREFLLSTLLLVGAIFFGNLLTIAEIALLLYAPWPLGYRVATAVGMVAVCFLALLFVMLRFFSEKRWMQVTKADVLLARAVDKKD